MFIREETLEGQHVALEPLSAAHVDPLREAVLDGEHWKLWYANEWPAVKANLESKLS